jgi:hypothetical protein
MGCTRVALHHRSVFLTSESQALLRRRMHPCRSIGPATRLYQTVDLWVHTSSPFVSQMADFDPFVQFFDLDAASAPPDPSTSQQGEHRQPSVLI